MYGCETWTLTDNSLHTISVAWNNCFRRIFKCCWRESTKPLYFFCKTMSIAQFPFKAKRSTAMCSMVLKEVISYYVNNGSSVFFVFLNATKAFDRVQYCSLFDKLLTTNVDLLF